MKPGINFPSATQVDILFDIVNVNRGPLQVAVSVVVGDKKRVLSDSFRTDSTIGIFYDSFMKTKGVESAYETSLYNGCKYNEHVYTMKGGEFSNGEGKLEAIMGTTKLLMKARAMHYILPNETSGIMSSSSSKIQELSIYTGYRLKVTAASKNTDGYTRLTVSNVGIAPTLYDLNVVHKGVTFEPTLRNLKPGASRYVYGKIVVGDKTQFHAEGTRYLEKCH